MAKSTVGGVTKTTAFRLGEHTLALLDAIAAEPEFEGNRTAALKAAIRRLHHQTIEARPCRPHSDRESRKAASRRLTIEVRPDQKKSRKKP